MRLITHKFKHLIESQKIIDQIYVELGGVREPKRAFLDATFILNMLAVKNAEENVYISQVISTRECIKREIWGNDIWDDPTINGQWDALRRRLRTG